MRQLSGHAAGFLYADTAHANANVSLLHIYDQATAPGGVVRFKRVLAHLEGRLARLPLFRQRLERVPLGLDHPYWVDDEQFDLEYHVRHIALPKPGDWRQFCIQASRIHARALDLDRPLWELYVIEGLDSFLDLPVGSFALLLKTHLAAVDYGQLGELTALLHDSAASAPAEPPPEPWFADAAPGRLGLLAHGALQNLRAPLRLAGPLWRAARQMAPAAFGFAREALVQPEHLPVTRFNAVVSPHRVFDTRRFTDDEVASICRLVPGANADDVVLAVCGGALRRWLDAEGELPPGHSLSALLPADAAGQVPSRLPPRWRHASLGTDIADPLQRLAAIRRARRRAPDAVARVLGNPLWAEAAERAPAPLLAMGRRIGGRLAALLGRRTPPAGCVVHVLPTPDKPQYLCGARMSYVSAILPISDGLALAFAVTRCDGRLVVSPTSCRELMPDPEGFTQAVRDTFQDYLALAAQRAEGHAAPATRAAPGRSRTSATPPRRARPRAAAAAATAPRPSASASGTRRRPRPSA